VARSRRDGARERLRSGFDRQPAGCFARANGRAVVAPLFAGSYLVLWTLVGLGVYAAYRPHGSNRRGRAHERGRHL
jgi:hypothetical protein